MDKQWSPTVQQRELYLISWDRTWWKIVWKNNTHTHTHTHTYLGHYVYSRNWQNTVDQLNFNKTKNKNPSKKKKKNVESTNILLEVISKFSKVTGYKMNGISIL